MSVRARAAAWLGVLAPVLVLAGCAVQRLDKGVYHSSKGFRVEVPGGQWAPDGDSEADLALRHRESPAAMAASAVCGGPTVRRSPQVLARQLLIGIRERTVIEQGDVEIGGRPAVRVVVDGQLEGSQDRVRIEALVLKDDRCVYDFMYVAAPSVFGALRPDFTRFVESFRAD